MAGYSSADAANVAETETAAVEVASAPNENPPLDSLDEPPVDAFK